MRYLCYALLLNSVFSSGCNKEREEPEACTLINEVSVALNVDVYTSIEDYNTNTNVLMSRRVEVGKVVEIPMEELFKADSEFYFDVYSDDYAFSNWPVRHRSIKIYPGQSGFGHTLSASTFKNRIAFLDGSKLQKTWKAIDAIHSTERVSIWNEIPEDEKHLRITITKAQDAVIELKQSGTLTEYHEYIYVAEADDIMDVRVVFSISPGVPGGGAMGDRMFSYNGNIDTLMCWIGAYPYPPRTYIMVREN